MRDEERLLQAMADIENSYLAMRVAAIQILGEARYAPALPKLIEMLRDETRDERTRASAARAIARIDDERAIPIFAEVLRHIPPIIAEHLQDADKPLSTVSLSGVLLGAAITKALELIANDTAKETLAQWQRGDFMAEVEADKQIAQAIADLDSSDLTLRRSAIRTLGEANYAPAVPKLIPFLNFHYGNDTVEHVDELYIYEEAAHTLGLIGTSESVKALIRALADIPNDVKFTKPPAVVQALTDLGTPEAQEALEKWEIGLLRDEYPPTPDAKPTSTTKAQAAARPGSLWSVVEGKYGEFRADYKQFIDRQTRLIAALKQQDVRTPAAEVIADMVFDLPLSFKAIHDPSAHRIRGQLVLADQQLGDLLEESDSFNAADELKTDIKSLDTTAAKLLRQWDEVWNVGRRTKVLDDALSHLGEADDTEAALHQVMDAFLALTGAERSFIVLTNPNTGALDQFHAVQGIDTRHLHPDSDRETQADVIRGVIEQAASSGEPILTDNAQFKSRLTSALSVTTFSLRSIMAVPLKAKGTALGVVYLDNRIRSGVFRPQELDLLNAFSHEAAGALQKLPPAELLDDDETLPIEMGQAFGTATAEAPLLAEEAAAPIPPPQEVMPPASAPALAPPPRQAATETQETPDAAIVRSEPAKPLPAKKSALANIQFSAYHPKTLKLEDWQPLYAYIFRENVASAVVADAFTQLGQKQAGYSAVTQPSQQAIADGAQITATPNAAGLQFNPVSMTIGFYDDWARFDFKLRAKDAPLHKFATGSITFTVEGIIVADVPLSVYIGEEGGHPEINSAVTQLYQSIFCSYSHEDTKIVQRVERAYKALGLDYLRDVTTLRSGTHWSKEILELIDRADIFQLFWSKPAAESKYVRQEWEHALKYEKERANFIRPVWWKEPMPPVPKALSHIHFAYEPELDDK